MTDAKYSHDYQVGEAVLARVDGALIPGIIEDRQEGKLLVRLSKPWTDAAGQRSDEAWFTPDQLDPSLDEETGGTQALPD